MRSFSFRCIFLAGAISPLLARGATFSEIPSEAYVRVETDPKGITWPWRVFKSSPHTPPNLTITGNGGELAPGYIFMTPQTVDPTVPAAEENGGFIVTSDNELVYALNISGITDFRKETYKGEPYLVCKYLSHYSIISEMPVILKANDDILLNLSRLERQQHRRIKHWARLWPSELLGSDL